MKSPPQLYKYCLIILGGHLLKLCEAEIHLDNGTHLSITNFSLDSQSAGIQYTANIDGPEGLDSLTVTLNASAESQTFLLEYEIHLQTTPCRKSFGLARRDGILLFFEPESPPQECLSISHFRDWWTRPYFTQDLAHLPDRTAMLIMHSPNGENTCLLSLCGETCQSEWKSGHNGQLCLAINDNAGGFRNSCDLAAAISTKADPFQAIEACFSAATIAHPGSPLLRGEKRYPPVFEYLGWCTWDAFYTSNINVEQGVLQKAEEFRDKQVPIRWVIIDDGWLQAENESLTSFSEDRRKFPLGLASLIHDLKEKWNLLGVGVWHTLGGYWGGIAPGSPLAEEEQEHLYRTRRGKLLPHWNPARGFTFWSRWYASLRRKGVDFVKVDGQSALRNHYESDLPIGQVACGTHQALEGAAGAYFNSQIINCMGMAAENIWHRTSSAIARNSDDFVPDRENSFGEHLIQNAYNTLYQGPMYYCDCDMFWTKHPDATRHAVLRAISGGPVYISDKIGETESAVLQPLVYRDGMLLRCDGNVLPTADCIYRNPTKAGLLKLWNHCQDSYVMALFNITGAPAEEKIPLVTIPDLQGESFWVYDWFERKACQLPRDGTFPCSLSNNGVKLLLLVPAREPLTPIGLAKKYVSPHSIQSRALGRDYVRCHLRESGPFAFAGKRPQVVTANGKDVSHLLRECAGHYRIDLPEEDEAVSLNIRLV